MSRKPKGSKPAAGERSTRPKAPGPKKSARPAPGNAAPTRKAPSTTLECFAITAPGFEPVVREELAVLGIDARAVPGGCEWRGSISSIALANLWLRGASRVVARVATFRARTFFELERNARRIAWERFLIPGSAVAFRVTCRKSKLYHSDAVAQRFQDAVRHKFGESVRIEDAVGVETSDDDTPEFVAPSAHPANRHLFIVRFDHDQCTVSADSSGELLHRRGYREASGKAPVRETIAAGMLLASGWRGEMPLIDPFCGSGTIPIEAALIARNMPPGARRKFTFERWPEHSAPRWTELREHAVSSARTRAPVPIVAADRDAGAIAAARANAERAGVADDITFVERALSDTEPVADDGAVVTNPPYGERVGKAANLRDLYAQLGHLMRGPLDGWSLTALVADRGLEGQLALPMRELLRTTNGGIPVRVVSTVPADPEADPQQQGDT